MLPCRLRQLNIEIPNLIWNPQVTRRVRSNIQTNKAHGCAGNKRRVSCLRPCVRRQRRRLYQRRPKPWKPPAPIPISFPSAVGAIITCRAVQSEIIAAPAAHHSAPLSLTRALPQSRRDARSIAQDFQSWVSPATKTKCRRHG